MLTEKGKADAGNLLRKIFITFAASTGTYVVTTVAKQSEAWALMLSAFVGGVTLVVQFLVDVEARQHAVEASLLSFTQHQRDMAQRIESVVKTHLELSNEANALFAALDATPLGRHAVTEFVRRAGELSHSAPPLANRLAETEIFELSSFLKDLGRGREVTADGDGWPWNFTLATHARESIDATSYLARAEAKQSLWDDDMWMGELGQRYLALQEAAVKRGVTIRRIFVLEMPGLAEHPELRRIRDQQIGVGIDVLLIDTATATGISARHVPLVIFDRVISLELTPTRFPAASPGFIKTTLVLNPFQVHDRVEMFERLWNGAQKV